MSCPCWVCSEVYAGLRSLRREYLLHLPGNCSGGGGGCGGGGGGGDGSGGVSGDDSGGSGGVSGSGGGGGISELN